jgi:uncharacterized protein YciI
MYCILFYKTVENLVEKRTPYRQGHLALAEAGLERGNLVMTGALEGPSDAHHCAWLPIGSIMRRALVATGAR